MKFMQMKNKVNKETVVSLSSLDEDRFGIRIAKAFLTSLDFVPKIIEFCSENKVEMLITRCSTNEVNVVNQLQILGFQLMDTLVYYLRDLKTPIPENRDIITIREIIKGEESQVIKVASNAFTGYFGHYHADPKLDPHKCDQVYVSWAERSCQQKDVAEIVYVAEFKHTIVGFITLILNTPDESEVILNGIDPEFQRMGIYRELLIKAMKWSSDRGATRLLISTQITNIHVQKAWVRDGFEPNKSYYTFHKWFDKLGNS